MKVCSLKVFASILIINICCSCSDRNMVKRIMGEFIETEVVIQENLDCIYNKQLSKIRTDTLKPYKFIIYYDTTDCSSCRISHLTDLKPLYDMANTSEFTVLTIFSPAIEDVNDVILQLTITNHFMPIYVDAIGEFRRLNKDLPSDHRFHSFLLDENNKPIFVGNPLNSTKLSELFAKKINESVTNH